MLSTNSTHPPVPDSSQGNPSLPDELEQLAAMTGYSPPAPPGKTKPQTATILKPQVLQAEADANDDTPLLDAEDLAETEQTDAKTKTPLWSNPLAKAGFVTALMGLAIGTVGIFLWSVNGNWNSQLAQQPKPQSPVVTPSPTTDPQQAEVGRLKTVAALGSQAQTLRQNAKNPTVLSRNMPTKAVRPTNSIETPTRSSPPVVYSPPQSYASPVTPPPQSSIATRTQPVVSPTNPQEAWRIAQALGSFGQTSEPNQPGKNAAPTVSPSDDPQQARYDADAAALLSGAVTRVARIVPGAIATATLKTPIIWAQDLKSSQQPQRFGLELTQPLRAADGTVALPTGTQMIAKVDTISGSGLVELSVEAIVVPTNQGNRVVNVPTGGVFVAGQDGNPLMASNYTNTHKQLLGKDIGIALMGALGQVGTLLNRPLNESTTTSPYLSSTNVSNGRTNILGGLLQGGFGALQNQVSQRQQQDVQAILNRPNVWYIPSDRPVQVFINFPFEVRL
ncbi:MAG: TrbI/VirB10 family protein [Kovacikia sp.]